LVVPFSEILYELKDKVYMQCGTFPEISNSSPQQYHMSSLNLSSVAAVSLFLPEP
jgi:hypothetical protein